MVNGNDSDVTNKNYEEIEQVNKSGEKSIENESVSSPNSVIPEVTVANHSSESLPPEEANHTTNSISEEVNHTSVPHSDDASAQSISSVGDSVTPQDDTPSGPIDSRSDSVASNPPLTPTSITRVPSQVVLFKFK